MRKFPKAFQRRKSTANAFEEVENGSPVEPSFKVFERPDAAGRSFDGGVKFPKPAPSGPGRPKKPQNLDDNMFENLGNNRGSGASNSNTASTTDNSSRLSASSTAPSSTGIPGREESRNQLEKPYGNIPIPPVPKSGPTFSLKNAGRAMSWGRKTLPPTHPPTPVSAPPSRGNPKDLPPVPIVPIEVREPTGRNRAVTASSYASTATPPRLEEEELGLSLGGDFSDMFSGFDKRKSAVIDSGNSRAMSRSPESFPTAPAQRPNRFNQPSPLHLEQGKQSTSPYSFSSHNSNDGLMSNRSPPPLASPVDSPPPVPQHGIRQINGSSPVANRSERPGSNTESGLRRSSALAGRRQSTLEYGDAIDEDAKLLRDAVMVSRRMNENGNSSRVRDSWALPSNSSIAVDDAAISSWRAESSETTPKSRRVERNAGGGEEITFDSHILEAAVLADRFQGTSDSPTRAHDGPHKVMTPAQFERYKQDKERLRSLGGQSRDDEDDEEEVYDDDEDEAEKAKAAARQRRKQEAHMAVYRQQMMKVTGETPPMPSRPAPFASQSSPNLLHTGKPDDGEEEDEEVPLAILQAHGFPNKNKPPMRSMGSNPNLRASTMSGTGPDGGRLPVFARNLPQDPYNLGAGLQNPMHRESMAFGGGAGSVVGGPTQRLPPGGLVGVIATEERSRALRRGSPNAQGDYGSPLPPNYPMGMPPNHPSANMFNGMGPMGPMGMNPNMLSPADQQQIQMRAEMQQFMAMQMQFMQMMTAGGGGGAPPPVPQLPQQGMRPNSSQHLRPGSGAQTHQRAMTMMEPNAAPWMQGPGFAPSINIQGAYAPSIAPSERSNVGMPGRYRPVSQAPIPSDNRSRMSTMSGGLNGWDTKNSTSTIRPVKQSEKAEEEDDDEGWEEMAKKREKKKSMWKSKRETNSLGDLFHALT